MSFIKNKKEENNELFFTLNNVDASYANALRRTILSDIKTVSIDPDDIIIHQNNTKMHNEIIKHRISCIPIFLKSINDINRYKLILDVNNETNNIIDITTEDISIYDSKIEQFLPKENVKTILPPNYITNDYILLLRVYPKINNASNNEKIHLECKLSYKSASENGVFNVVSTCSYAFTIDPVKQNTEWLKYQKQLSSDANNTLEKKNWYLHEGKRHFKKDSFDFIIETIGVYSNQEIVKLACKTIIEKLQNISREIENKTIEITNGNTVELSYDIKIPNDNYTIGKIIEQTLYTLFYKNTSMLSFVGYLKEHPHIHHGLIRIMFHDKSKNEEHIYNMFIQSIEFASKIFQSISNQI